MTENLFDLTPKDSVDALFGRDKELDEVVRLIKAKRWIALLGPRMVGKTSLIKVANNKLGSTGIYMNLWGIKTTYGVLTSLISTINTQKSLREKLYDSIRSISGISISSNGISITKSSTIQPLKTTWELLNAIGNQTEKCVIELDEVQELSSVAGQFHRILGNIFNTYPNLVFVFTGSMFGLMKTITEPAPSSPLYGRAPAKIPIRSFPREISIGFLKKGFAQYKTPVSGDQITEAVDNHLGGIPGWLTLYGSNVALRKMSQKRAIEETVSEGLKITRIELEHFLDRKDKKAYIAAMKVIAKTARWSEIKDAVRNAKNEGTTVNDGTIHNILDNLKDGMLANLEEGTYSIGDPMMRHLLLRR